VLPRRRLRLLRLVDTGALVRTLVVGTRERLSDRDPDAPGEAARVVHPTSPASGPRWQPASTIPAQIKGDANGGFTERHPAGY
jgi:hypothetical protein